MLERRHFLALAATAGAGLLAGCGTVGESGGGKAAAKDAKDVTIGFLQRQLDAPYYTAMQVRAEEIAKEKGFKLLFQNASGDPVTQLDQAQTLLSQGADVLVVNAISPDTEKAQLTSLSESIPVLFIDTGIPDVGVTTVGSDNEAIGKLAGEVAGKRFEKGSSLKLAILNGGPNDEIVGPARQKGFLAGLETNGIKAEIVAEAAGNYAQDQSIPAAESMLAAHPDIQLFLGLNDAMALGALTVLSDQKNTEIHVAGIDGQKEALQKIQEGGCTGQYVSTGLNSPSAATDKALEVALSLATGKTTKDDYKPAEYIKGAGIGCENVAEYYDPNSVF